jgi:hypothetical protein
MWVMYHVVYPLFWHHLPQCLARLSEVIEPSWGVKFWLNYVIWEIINEASKKKFRGDCKQKIQLLNPKLEYPGFQLVAAEPFFYVQCGSQSKVIELPEKNKTFILVCKWWIYPIILELQRMLLNIIWHSYPSFTPLFPSLFPPSPSYFPTSPSLFTPSSSLFPPIIIVSPYHHCFPPLPSIFPDIYSWNKMDVNTVQSTLVKKLGEGLGEASFWTFDLLGNSKQWLCNQHCSKFTLKKKKNQESGPVTVEYFPSTL